MTRPAPTRIAKWLGLAYAAGLAAFFLIGADAPDVVVLSLLFLPFYLGSAAAAAMLVKASRTRLGAWIFLAVEAAIVASTPAAFAWAQVMADRDLWTAAGASVFMAFVVPVYQYAAVLAVFVFAFLLGWRARDSWLRA